MTEVTELERLPTKLGAPRKMSGGKRKLLYLDAPSIEEALIRGNGNVSEGVRIALAESSERRRLNISPGEDQKTRERLESKGQQRLTD